MSIYEPNQSFQFQNVSLTTPTIVSGGNYFIKFRMTDDEPLYIQPPKCTTKQGFVKTNGGKKMYSDLVFSNSNESFIKWVEDLEKFTQESIFNNREKWFESQLELEDIENSFTPSLKIYKSGKMYLLRTIVPTRLGNCGLKIFNEDQTEFNIDEFKETTNVLTILEVQGVKCSSKSFQLEIEIKQMMVLKPNILFDKCIIKSGQPENVPSLVENKNIVSLNVNSLGETLLLESKGVSKSNNTQIYPPPDSGNPNIKVEKEIIQSSHIIDISPKNKDINTLPKDHSQKGETKEDGGDDTPNNMVNEQHDEDDENDEDEYEDEDDDKELVEIEFDLKSIDTEEEPINLKERNEIYKNIYKEAVEKAKEARNLAIYSYLEAKRIKNLYLIQEM